MALRDLIVQKKHITEELLEDVLKTYVRLVEEDQEVVLLPATEKLLIKQKVLLYLAGVYAWDLLLSHEKNTPLKNSDIEQALGVEGNTLRPILKTFRDSQLIEQVGDGVVITYKGVESLQDIDDGKQIEKQDSAKAEHIKNQQPSKMQISGRETVVETLRNSSFDINYVEKMLTILRNVKNIDKYLLALYIAKTELGVDGMTPGEVNLFLTNPPFKMQKMFTTNISRDLGNNFKNKAWVNPYESAGKHGLVYRLTSKGEKRVDDLFAAHKNA